MNFNEQKYSDSDLPEYKGFKKFNICKMHCWSVNNNDAKCLHCGLEMKETITGDGYSVEYSITIPMRKPKSKKNGK